MRERETVENLSAHISPGKVKPFLAHGGLDGRREM